MDRKITENGWLNVAVKLLYIFVVLLGIVALLFTWMSPATGYEGSIYEYTPAILWIFIVISICLAIYTTVVLRYRKNLFRYGLFLIVFCYTICVSLYIIRGYYMWDIVGDVATHNKFINEILGSGFFSPSLFYPVQHIYAASFVELTNIGLPAADNLIPLLFDVLYIPFMYILARVFLNKREAGILAIVSSIFVNQVVTIFVPSLLSSLYLPLALFVFLMYMNTRRLSWGLLSLAMVILYAPFHVMSAAILALIMAAFCIGKYVIDRIYRGIAVPGRHKIAWMLPVLLVVWLFSWIYSYSIFNWTLYNTFSVAATSTSYLSGVGTSMTYAQTYGYNAWEYIAKTEGIVAIFLLLALGSIVLLYPYIKGKKTGPPRIRMLILFAPILMLLALSVALMVQKSDVPPMRVIIFVMILCSILVAFVLSELSTLMSNIRNRFLNVSSRAIFGVFIILIFLNGILILYPSNYNWTISYQSTKSEISTMNWLLDARSDQTRSDILTIIDEPYRYQDLFSRYDSAPPVKIIKQRPPWHFGYPGNSSLASYYQKPMYLVMTGRDISYYQDLFPQMASLRFNDSDYVRLGTDNGLDKIYCTKETTVFSLGH